FRCLALTSLALSIPAFALAVSAFQTGGANYILGTVSAALIGTILLGGTLFAYWGSRRSGRNRSELNPRPSPNAADTQLWSSARVCWSLAVCCAVISALFLIPSAITFAEWRFESGALQWPTSPPPLECIVFTAVGFAFLFMAMGMLYRRHRSAVWGFLLFLVLAVSAMAYGLIFSVV
ncbi:MAG: hypothetical protein CMJ48_05350, partial [Planctomycetaceae bacterium]|nr:hypothetical protein [Planctomycetaceae bacterium]